MNYQKKKAINRLLIDHTVNSLNRNCSKHFTDTKTILNNSGFNIFQKNYVFCGPKKMIGSYIEHRSWMINSNLDIVKFKMAWTQAKDRFEALKLAFNLEYGHFQLINKLRKLDFKFIDLSQSFNLIEQTEKIKLIKSEDMATYYDLKKGSLFRVYVIKLRTNSFVCLLSNHIAILDNQIFILLKKYVEKTYEFIRETGKLQIEPNLKVNKISQVLVREPIQSNTAFLDVSKINSDCDINGLMLNSLSNNYKLLSPRINYMRNLIKVEGNNYKKLKEIATKNNFTLHSICQYVWHKIISIYSNNTKTVVGTLVPGNASSIDDINKYMGSTLNILPLSIDHKNFRTKNGTILESIKSISIEINKLCKFGYKDFTGQTLINNMLFYEENDEIILSDYNCYLNLTKYPIILKAAEYNNQLDINILFNGNIYSSDRMIDVTCIIENLLQIIIDTPLKNESELNFIPKNILKRVVFGFNKTDKKYLKNITTVHELFEKQVVPNNKNIAVIDDNAKITYEELDTISNKLANYLIASGLKKGNLVGISVHKSINLVISLLGVIKAGGVYIPFSTSYSTIRLDAMLDDSKPSMLIGDDFIEEWLPKYEGKIIRIDSKEPEYYKEKELNPKVNIGPKDLIYIIYTSGSTGEPKGVMIEHESVVNTLQDINLRYSVTNKDKVIAISNISFDLSVYDIFGIMAVGGTVVFPNVQKENDVSYLLDIIEKNSITIWNSTPALMDKFINNIVGHNPNYQLKSLRLVLVSGDWIPLNLSKNINRKVPNKNLVISGLGGATEVSIWSVYYQISKVDLAWRSVPYGKPLYNQVVYILDNNMMPVPIGAIGEIYIGGKGLARGYFKQPSLTSDKFKNIKLKDAESEREYIVRVYKTEDLGRYMDDGNIEFLGRTKNSIMINGLRLWPGVIETLISQYPGIKQNVVLTNHNDQYLVCYYVADSQLNKDSIIKFLDQKISKYLIPTKFTKIDNLPLSRNGKLDRGALLQLYK